MFLNSKRLLGNSFTSPKNTDTNIWVSNFTANPNIFTTQVVNGMTNSENLKNFNTFEESRNFFFTRSLLFLNNKVLLPTKNFTICDNLDSLPYNTSHYYTTQELHNRNIFNNNNLLFFLQNPKNISTSFSFSQPSTEVSINNTLNSVEFLVNNSSVLVSELTNTQPLTSIVLPINKNLR